MILSAKCFAVGTRGVLLFCINWHKCPVLHSDSSADQWQESQHRYLGLWGYLLKFVFHSCFQVPVVVAVVVVTLIMNAIPITVIMVYNKNSN